MLKRIETGCAAAAVAIVIGNARAVVAQDLSSDEAMLCRFVLDGVQELSGADPEALAINTGVGGYYWGSAFVDESYADGVVERVERFQYWLYPWTTYPDDARSPKGVGVVFRAERLLDGSLRWIADRGYAVGFTPQISLGGPRELSVCNWAYPSTVVVQAGVSPLRWEGAPDCEWAREHANNSPHAAPPGCE